MDSSNSPLVGQEGVLPSVVINDEFFSSSITSRVSHTITIQQKNIFIMTALDNGWHVKKRHNKYIFTKKHKGKKSFFINGFLENFLEMNIIPETEETTP